MTTMRPHAMRETLCGAKTRSGGPCRQPAMPNGRCRLHGGKTPSGIASANFKTGRYGKYLPPRLMARYAESEADGELLNLRAEVSLVDARLADLLSRVDTGEAASLWEKARKTNQEIQKAVHDENYGRMLIMALDLDRLIGDGLADYEAWGEVESLLDQRRKLVESERKRLIEMQQMVRADEVMMLMTAILAAVKANVTDRAALSAIQTEFMRLTNFQPAGAEE